jgi:Raf kinase inhibitor-like YbhB/YbcL family protein
VPSFQLVSDDIADGRTMADEFVFDQFGMIGKNQSPHLRWHGYPGATLGFGVTCFDPDAPSTSGFWHWMLYDLPVQTTELASGCGELGGSVLPAGARHARNDYGTPAYGGPAPTKGEEPHRYLFAVHALDCARLDVDDDATPAVVGHTMTARTLARALVVPVYGR